MPGYINASGNYRFEDIGIVHVVIKANARSIHARWKGGQLQATVPPGVEYDVVDKALRNLEPRLEQIKPDALYYIGQRMEFPEFAIEISSQSYVPDKMIMRYDPPLGTIQVGSRWDMSKPDTMSQISKYMCRIAQHIAPEVLLPQAHQIASRVGKAPLMWTISNGHRTLGHCSAKGVIALSYAIVFFPVHLREFVICHELAHLTEMNHSPRFHAICDDYCGGRESELHSELKKFKFPIIR